VCLGASLFVGACGGRTGVGAGEDAARGEFASDCDALVERTGAVDLVWQPRSGLVLAPSFSPLPGARFHALRCSVFFNVGDDPGRPPTMSFKSDGTPATTAEYGPPVGRVHDAGAFAALEVDPVTDSFTAPELWVTDGTRAGSRRLRPWLFGAVALDGRLVFGSTRTDDRADTVFDWKPWTTDGSEQGTRALSGRNATGAVVPRSLYRAGESVYYWAGNSASVSLFRTDGLAIRKVKDALGPPASSGAFVSYGEGAAFVARETDGPFGLFCSDGTEDGTRMVERLDAERAPGIAAFTERGTYQLAEFRGEVFLLAYPDTNPGFDFSTYCSRGARIALFATDCTTETRLIALAEPDPECDSTYPLARTDGALYFADGARQLWRSDGTAAGTRTVYGTPGNVTPLAASANATPVAVGRRVFWVEPIAEPSALDGPRGTLFSLDDSSVEAEPLAEVLFWSAFSAARAGDELVFAGYDPDAGEEPWVTDGTRAGTRRLRDLRPGTEGSHPGLFAAVADRAVFFSATEDGVVAGLYKAVLPAQ
jgi:ELWxxDGT repeat protein